MNSPGGGGGPAGKGGRDALEDVVLADDAVVGVKGTLADALVDALAANVSKHWLMLSVLGPDAGTPFSAEMCGDLLPVASGGNHFWKAIVSGRLSSTEVPSFFVVNMLAGLCVVILTGTRTGGALESKRRRTS